MSYNGWANYETWRVRLEVFDALEFDYELTEEAVKDIAHDYILADIEEGSIAYGIIDSWLSNVDWWEITDSLNEDYHDRRSR